MVKGMNFSQSIQAPLTLNDTAYLSGNLSSPLTWMVWLLIIFY